MRNVFLPPKYLYIKGDDVLGYSLWLVGGYLIGRLVGIRVGYLQGKAEVSDIPRGE